MSIEPLAVRPGKKIFVEKYFLQSDEENEYYLWQLSNYIDTSLFQQFINKTGKVSLSPTSWKMNPS
jgi:hypothetical protein